MPRPRCTAAGIIIRASWPPPMTPTMGDIGTPALVLYARQGGSAVDQNRAVRLPTARFPFSLIDQVDACAQS